MEPAHDDGHAMLVRDPRQLFGVAEAAGHRRNRHQIEPPLFEQPLETLENLLVVIVLRHRHALDNILNGGSQIADADAIGSKSWKRHIHRRRSLDKADVLVKCHRWREFRSGDLMAMRRTAVADTVREVGIYGICMTNGQAGGLEVGRV